MDAAYRDRMEINDLAILHSRFGECDNASKGHAEMEYPGSKAPLNGDSWADIWTIVIDMVTNYDGKDFSYKKDAFEHTIKHAATTEEGYHWNQTIYHMVLNNLPRDLSVCRKLAEGSKQLPDQPCDESIHVISRILAAQWAQKIALLLEEKDKRENARLKWLRDMAKSKENELQKSEDALQSHLQTGIKRRQR